MGKILKKFLAAVLVAIIVLSIPVVSFANEQEVGVRDFFENEGVEVEWSRYLWGHITLRYNEETATLFVNHDFVVFEDINILHLAAGDFDFNNWGDLSADVFMRGDTVFMHLTDAEYVLARLLDPHVQPTPQEEAAIPPRIAGELVVGTTVRPTGNFVRAFAQNTTDQWVRELMHGAAGSTGTMALNQYGHWIPNPLVLREPIQTRDNPNGSRTHTFTIFTDNLWSDGTPITAQDYVFNILVNSSNVMRNHGGAASFGWPFEGFDAFTFGDTDVFAGVRLYSDDSFSVTVTAEHLPFVWEFMDQNFEPVPVHYWAAGGPSGRLFVVDTPNGAKIENVQDLDLLFTFDSLLDIDPISTVVAGAYTVYSFDRNDTVVLERNPLFGGTWDGYMPAFERIIIRYMDQTSLFIALATGEIDMIHGMRTAANISTGLDIIDNFNLHRAVHYPRSGYVYLGFHGDHGPTQFPEVRRAVAWLLDREAFMQSAINGLGTVIHGPYLYQGWEHNARGAALYNNPAFNHYTLNIENAIAELEAGGWVLNAYGEPFNPDVDELRFKDVSGMYNWLNEPIYLDGNLMPLEIIWAANDNILSDVMRVQLLSVARSIGMNIVEELYPTGTTNIPAWQRAPGTAYAFGGEKYRTHHMFTLAVGLGQPMQLWNQWSLYDSFMIPGFNTTWHGDWQLHDLAWGMRYIDPNFPGWEDRYLDLWLQFQLRYNYVMPVLPIYQDWDHDFIPIWLENWLAGSVWDFSHAIQRAYDGRRED